MKNHTPLKIFSFSFLVFAFVHVPVQAEIGLVAQAARQAVQENGAKTKKNKGKAQANQPSASRQSPAPVQPAMSRAEIEAGLKSRDRALYIKQNWIRDPYIKLGPDDFYYLTGTTPNPCDPREASDPYNIGLGPDSIVGSTVQVWRSEDLIDWEPLAAPFTLKDSFHKEPGELVWAPELHWLGDRWALVHCPGPKANLAVTAGPDLKGPWKHPLGEKLGVKHDPSLFQDDNTWWLLWKNTEIAPLNSDFTDFAVPPVRIDPAGSRINAAGKSASVIGHEGATMLKVGKKYVHLGTAWSTDEGRKGSYNLYYCTADKITGPYGPRKFAGRFLGHGTPFQTRDGNWWCTAFFNGNVPPLPREGIEKRDLSANAQTINQRGTTIVPLEVKIQEEGDVFIRALDPAYAAPGPDEVQKFTTKAAEPMLTEWGAKVTAENAWREYPRPALARTEWSSLNGRWQYQVTPIAETKPSAQWVGDILVPFAIESSLSGVKKRITPSDALWYRRTFEAPALADGRRLLLNFEAVDYQSTIWVNDTEVGKHTGGNLPFSLDITKAVKPGANTLTVRVTDATDTDHQLHGKQVLNPGGIWYTPVTGIWQTVWLESVPTVHIATVKITPAISGRVAIRIETSDKSNPQATVKASLNGKEVASVTGPADSLTLNIPSPQLWSPDSPTLYDLTISLGGDKVASYVGLRETTVGKDADGNLRLLLNGKPLFHFGTLDQGWWPDGLLTPPSDAGMKSDVEFLKAAGFNTLRKHIKIEPRRYYTHCDRLGILVWQDQVSSGTGKQREKNGVSPPWTRLQPNPVDAEWPDAAHEQYMVELKTMMETLGNHPSIIQWVTFNEAWGQHRTVEVGKWAVAADPTRQINIASGGNFHPAGHIVDHHQYPHPGFPFELGQGGRFDGFVKIVGEFGGHGYPVEGHLWDPNARNWGYGGLPKNKEEWLDRYKTSITKLAELKKQGIAAGIYTQTTDVEAEINGLITYDRKVQKLAPSVLAEIHKGAGLVP